MEQDLPLSRVASASAILLFVLCAITLFTGTSQQWFEWVQPPAAYAAALVQHASPLRVIIAIDDVFIASYVAMALLFVKRLGGASASPLFLVAMIFSVTAGALDLEENHHLLALLRVAEAGVPIPLEEILRRSDLSQLKWMLGHVAFALIGLGLAPSTQTAKLFRASLVFFQLPVGALTWAVTRGPVLTTLIWVRYGALIGGFAAVAWLTAARRAAHGAPVAIDSGAPA